ncbi:MAG: PIN domain-containing protein [Deltaproteobacteria bacterium]|nr:PIN domain-containing protein [Deltaproteobacteria bacterium]
MAIAFIDTSVLLRFLLKEPGAYPHLEKFKKIYASELLKVEALRAIDRLRIQNNWSKEEVALRIQLLTASSSAIHFIPIQVSILRRASEPFPTLVGTLDAIHIATALLTQIQSKEELLFITHDRNQGLAAQAAGLRVAT